jgi:hypothetical protein
MYIFTMVHYYLCQSCLTRHTVINSILYDIIYVIYVIYVIYDLYDIIYGALLGEATHLIKWEQSVQAGSRVLCVFEFGCFFPKYSIFELYCRVNPLKTTGNFCYQPKLNETCDGFQVALISFFGIQFPDHSIFIVCNGLILPSMARKIVLLNWISHIKDTMSRYY